MSEPVAGIVRGSRRALGTAGAVFALLALAGAGTASADPACTSTWTGGGGDGQWTTAANWSTGVAPTAADHACIAGFGTIAVSGGAVAGSVTAGAATLDVEPGGTLTVADPAAASTVAALTLDGGTLTGAGAVDVTSALTLNAGTVSGSGTLAVDDTATGTIGAAVALDQRTLANHGALTLAAGTLTLSGAATIANDDTFTIDSEAPAALTGDGTLVNAAAGTVVKDAGSGTTALAVALDDTGTLSAASGAFALPGGAGASGGAVTLRDGATLDGVVKLAGAVVTAGEVEAGTADVRLSAGSLGVEDGATFAVRLLTVSGGALTGAGDVRVGKMLTWTGGTLSGSGSTGLGAGAAGYLAPGATGSVLLDGRRIDNQGALTLVNGALRGANGATIANSGMLYVNSEAAGAVGGSGTIVNTGTVAKNSGSGTTAIAWTVDNAGSLDAGNGALRLAGAVTLRAGTALHGALTFAGIASVPAALDASAADVTLPGGGALTLAAPLTVASLTQSGGSLSGAGTITIDNALTWTAGAMTGAGATVLPAGATATITPSAPARLSGRTLENHGTIRFSGDALHLTAAARVDNEAAVELTADGTALDASATSRFLNDGTVTKTGATGVTAIGVPFDNEGAVDGHTGTIALAAGGAPGDAGTWAGSVAFTGGAFTLGARTQATGKLLVDGAAVTVPDLQLPTGTLALASGTVTLSDAGSTSTVGALAQSGGTLAGPGSLAVVGALSWSGGTLGLGGTTALGAGATSTISGAATLTTGTLRNDGALTWSGGDVALQDGAALVNRGTLQLDAEGADLACGPRSVLVNDGTLGKDAGTGTTTSACAIANGGRIAPATGTLDLPDAIDNATGSTTLASGVIDCSATPAAGPSASDMEDLVVALLRDPGDATADAAAWAGDRQSYGDPDTLVLGEDDARVSAYATANGLSVFAPATVTTADPAAWLREQASFLRGAIADGATIVDLGPHPTASTAVRRPWTTFVARLLLAARGYPAQAADAPFDPATCGPATATTTTPPATGNSGSTHRHHHRAARRR